MSVEFYPTSLVIILMPGAAVSYAVAAGLTSGRRTSIVAALGCTFEIPSRITASILALAGEKVLDSTGIMQWTGRTIAMAFAGFGPRRALFERSGKRMVEGHERQT